MEADSITEKVSLRLCRWLSRIRLRYFLLITIVCSIFSCSLAFTYLPLYGVTQIDVRCDITDSQIAKAREMIRGFAPTRIPLILHQTWSTNLIPSHYVPYVCSWANKELSYYYWTDAQSTEFVAKHYPHLLTMFTSYKTQQNRADAMSFMLLHHYGGVYAHMDVMLLGDLVPVLSSSLELCILSQEREESSKLYWGRDVSVTNAVMISAPKHKFMEFVISALPKYAHLSPNVSQSTGQIFLQSVYSEYVKSPPCSLSEATCRCFVADSYMFTPQIDPLRIPLLREKCSQESQLDENELKACKTLDHLGWESGVNKISEESFTFQGFVNSHAEKMPMPQVRFIADMTSVRRDRQTFGVNFFN